jgi:hypothetical protein
MLNSIKYTAGQLPLPVEHTIYKTIQYNTMICSLNSS